ncbi:KR domain-containing protein [Pelagophyceae sp. CCMP2097]|nr:KR domain-containing protein [Pelagophyceae sp. CCMP2097]
MSEALAKWDEELYAARKPEIINEVDSKFCCLVEWVEQAMPVDEAGIRATLRGAGPCLPQKVIDAVPREDAKAAQRAPPALRVLCFSDVSGLCRAVVEAMTRNKNVKVCEMVDVYGNDALLDDDYLAALVGKSWDLVIFGAGVDPPESQDAGDVIAWSDTLLKLYLRLTKLIQRKAADVKKVCVLTSGTFSNDAETHAQAGVGVTASAFLFGMTNTVRMEALTPFHYVDTDYEVTPETVDACAREMVREAGFGEASVRLTAQGRFVARMVLAEPRYTSNKPFHTPPDGVIAIGGGNGALGLVMGKFFIENYLSRFDGNAAGKKQLKILFLSRSCRISGEGNLKAWAEIQSLVEGTPIVVDQARCDVSDRAAVQAFVEEHAAELCGFVHSAGVLHDGLLMNQTPEMYDEVYGPKAWAGLYLHDALERQPTPKLHFVWMFSSVAVYGNPGQSSYSGANSLLDCLARHRKALGKPATAMQWAGWGEVGMASQMEGLAKKRWEESPMPLFSNAQGLAGMQTGLSTGLPYFCVMRYNTEAFFVQANKAVKTAAERYFKKFWGAQAPPQELTELDLYERVRANFHQPQELVFSHFVAAGDEAE